MKSQQILIFVYQVLNGLSPQYFRSFYRCNSNYPDYSTRNSEQLTSEIRHTTRSGLMIKHVGVDIWNSVPESIRWSENLTLFKGRIKNYFLKIIFKLYWLKFYRFFFTMRNGCIENA